MAVSVSSISSQGVSSRGIISKTAARLDSIDLLRGIVMVIMLLDHMRDFVHGDSLNFDATDIARTNPILFFTRWITHFCAPTFLFLAGTGAYLQLLRGKSKSELSKFLATRGLWLVLLELTVMRIIIWFNLDFHFAFSLQVIWVIGVSMIALAGLIWLPLWAVAVIGVALIALHNLLDVIRVDPVHAPGIRTYIWMVLHQPGVISFTPTIYG
ncbi:MAG: DUF1624 domain-containing protein, partial [Blastocatellia bacterium]|nr:DUF1624 domain-containing protein [Blastocatellia bacterium]